MTSIPDPFPRKSHRPLRVLQDAGGLAPDKPVYQHFYHPEPEIKMMDAIAKSWKVDGIILHRNRGCHGLSIGIAENRLGPPQEGEKVHDLRGEYGGRARV